MSDYRTRATTEVIINGQQAQAEVDKLEKKVVNLRRQLDNVGKSKGLESKEAKKLEREIEKCNGQINIMKGNISIVDRILKNLNTARPHELRQTLRLLKTELQGIERGSAAWNAQIVKIRQVGAGSKAIEKIGKKQPKNGTGITVNIFKHNC